MTASDEVDLSNPCPHVTPALERTHVHRPAAGCAECLAIGSSWVHLRVCLSCGHVGCCDSSPNRHATAHYRHTHHPLITSAEVGETWAYCYTDQAFLSSE
jgi:uncharacterized UBP type Zn finger protein